MIRINSETVSLFSTIEYGTKEGGGGEGGDDALSTITNFWQVFLLY